MKKQLLCTSAIALGVAAAAPASAAEWNLDWGGFFNQHIAVGDISVGDPALADADFDGDGFDLHTNAEIIFTPSIELDNGLTFGVNVQFEANNSFSVDESYVQISSDTFGRLVVGSENSAGYLLSTGAPSVHSLFINSPSTSTFIPFTGVDEAAGAALVPVGTALPFRQAGISSFTEVQGNNDVQRITYYTPSFNGLTLGVSYANQGSVNAGNSLSVDTNTVISDIFDIGLNYSQSFGTADVTFSARYGVGDAPTTAAAAGDPETWGVGLSVSFGGFTIGGSYGENDNNEIVADDTALGTALAAGGVDEAVGFGDSEGWSLGIAYDAPGPWEFSLETYQSDTDIVDGGVVVSETDREAYALAASRDLGPGVNWDIYLIYEERDNDATAFQDVEGTILGTAINLSF